MNCHNSFRAENKLTSHEKVCENKDFHRILMSTEKKWQLNQYMKSDKIPYIIYADTESLIRKINGCANNPEKSSTIKVGEYFPCGYSISTILGFDHIENKHGLYRGKDWMKKFCDSLKEHAKNIVLFENKITSRSKSMLYLWKRNTRKVC